MATKPRQKKANAKEAKRKKKTILTPTPPPLTWQNVDSFATVMWGTLTQNAKTTPPLPFNQRPSLVMDLMCDEWFRNYFRAEIMPTEMPPDLAPWILARITAAMAMIDGYSQSGKLPGADTIEEVLMDLMIDYWNKSLSTLWPVFCLHPNGKTITFDFGKLEKDAQTGLFSSN
jgi:hypothetical protein